MKYRYKTYTVRKLDPDLGYIGHCCCTSYEKAAAIAGQLVADGWPAARVLGGSSFAFLLELRASSKPS